MRILLIDMTPMLASVVSAAIAGAPDLILAGHVGERENLASRIRRSRADVVMMQSADPGDTATLLPLLHRFPHLRVVAITADCRNGFIHELRLYSTRMTDLSAGDLADALRGRAAPLH